MHYLDFTDSTMGFLNYNIKLAMECSSIKVTKRPYSCLIIDTCITMTGNMQMAENREMRSKTNWSPNDCDCVHCQNQIPSTRLLLWHMTLQELSNLKKCAISIKMNQWIEFIQLNFVYSRYELRLVWFCQCYFKSLKMSVHFVEDFFLNRHNNNTLLWKW